MSKQYLDKEGLQVVVDNIKESKEVANGAVALAQSVNDILSPQINTLTSQVNTLTPEVNTLTSQVNTLNPQVNNLINANSYSFDEMFTGGTWVDGKKIYKKTYDLGNVPSPSGSSVYCRIPFTVDFDTVVEIKGMIVPNENSTQAQKEYYSIPKPPKVGGSDYNVSLKIKLYNNVLNLELETKSELNNKKAYATVYYTKTGN